MVDQSTRRAADPRLIRLLVARGAVVGIPVAVVVFVLFVLVHPVLAAVLALVVGSAVAVPVALRQARSVDDRVREQLGARPVDAAEQARFANLVANLAMTVGVTPPRLHVIDDPAANALVWGSGGGPASIAATTGMLKSLGRVELEAVVGHLLTRVRSGATAVPTTATGLFGERAGTAEPHPSPPEDIIEADLEAARLIRYPPGAIAALEALSALDTRVGRAPRGLASLWIADPAGDGNTDSHPTLAYRLEVLHEL